MNKVKVKSWFHLVCLVVVLAGAAYVACRQGVSLTEKIGAFGVLAAASLMALGKVLPSVDQAIDELPDEDVIRRLGPPAAIVLLAGSLLLSSCSSAQPRPTPEEVGRAVVTCTQTVCDGHTYTGPCVELTSAILACLASAGNVGVCLGGVPAMVQVGFADVVCVVDALDGAAVPPNVVEAAAKWQGQQRVLVRR